MTQPGSILFFRPGGLGDLLTTLPAMRLARESSPGRRTLLAASAEPGRLLALAGVADALLSCDDLRLRPLFTDGESGTGLPLLPAPPSTLWAWLMKEPPPGFRDNVGRLFGDEGRVFVYDPSSRLPAGSFFFARAAEALGHEPDEEDFERAARLPDFGPPPFPLPEPPFALIHPGSGGGRKNWPLDRFRAVAVRLRDQGLAGYFVTGPAEGPAFAASLPLPEGWRILHEPPLPALAGLLARCGAYVGNDSGVTHLAAVAGAPVLALFRDDSLPAWRPCGRTVVLRAAEPSLIPALDVLAALARFPAPSALQYRP
jgi:heptosyltransferase-3